MGKPTYRNKLKSQPRTIARISQEVQKQPALAAGFNSNAYTGGTPISPADPTEFECECCHNTLTVGPGDNADFTTIQEANDYAVTETPSATSPWVLNVCPGVYEETIILGDYISVVGVGRAESVIIKGATGPLITIGDIGSHVAYVKLQLEPTTNAQEAVNIPVTHTGPTELANIIYEISSATNDITAKFIDMNGGTVFIKSSHFDYDMDGTHANVKTHTMIDVSGTSIYHISNCETEFDVADINDIVIFVIEDSASTVQGYISNNRINGVLSHASYVGTAGLFVLHGVGTSKFIIGNHLTLTSAGGAGDTGYIVFMDTTAGGGVIRSIANHVGCYGFDNSYSVNVAAGDTVNSHFDKVYAVDGWTGAGTFNFAGSYTDGNFSVSNNINIANELRLLEGTNHIGFTAPALTTDTDYVWPAEDGNEHDSLRTDGSGILSWEPVGTAQSLFFLYNDASDIGGYRQMLPDHSAAGEETISVAITGAATLIEDFATDSGEPGSDFIQDGIYHVHVHAAKTAGTKDARIYFEVYKRTDPGGVETLITTSEESNLIFNAVKTEYDIEIAQDEFDLDPTDRLVLKMYGNPYGAGTDPTIALYVEGTTASRLELPVILPGTADTDELVGVDAAATPGYLGATSGTGVLRTAGMGYVDGGDFVTLTPYIRTCSVTYPQVAAAGPAVLFALAIWASQTITQPPAAPPNLLVQVDHPRRLNLTIINLDFLTPTTGTVTFNGFDADGKALAEVVVVNVPVGAPVLYTTSNCFSILTTAVVAKTDAHLSDTFSIGFSSEWGVPNIPLNAAGDVFKATVNGVDSLITAVDTTYGAVTLAGVALFGADVFILYRPFK